MYSFRLCFAYVSNHFSPYMFILIKLILYTPTTYTHCLHVVVFCLMLKTNIWVRNQILFVVFDFVYIIPSFVGRFTPSCIIRKGNNRILFMTYLLYMCLSTEVSLTTTDDRCSMFNSNNNNCPDTQKAFSAMFYFVKRGRHI